MKFLPWYQTKVGMYVLSRDLIKKGLRLFMDEIRN
jgi:hypothetical protein